MQRAMLSAQCQRRAAGGMRTVLGTLAAVMLLVSAATARAQVVQPVPEYYVAVTEDTQMKAGPGGVHYSVKTLKAGQVLRVDGKTVDHTSPFLRVDYLPGMNVFVKADEGVPEGNVLRLTAPSRLRALNASGGERGHWWFLLPEESLLPVGMVLPLMATLRAPEGRVYGYEVPAPAEARGYVREDLTRLATREEVDKFKEDAGAVAPEKEKPAAPPVTEPAPAPERPAAQTPPEEPPAAIEPGGAAPAAPEPAAAHGPEAEAPAAHPQDGKPASLEALQSLYQQAQSQPIREAELDEVIAEFQRTIDSMKGPEDQRTKDFLVARLELLKMRQDLQKSMRAAEELAGTAGKRTERFERDSAALDRARAYTVVGRLVPSTVYDGRRLPKMYRVQSVDEGFARTVAYLMPSEQLELDAKLGRVVGIVGETNLDPALRVNIIRPRRVDVLNPARSGDAGPAPAGDATASVPTNQGAAAEPR